MEQRIASALRLADDARFERYGEDVYLRRTRTRKDYLFNEIVYDILRCYDGGKPVETEAVLTALAGQYDIPDEAEFREDMLGFMSMLVGEGILEEVGPAKHEPALSVQDRVTTLCRKEHRLYSACLELTYRCNERCVHCYVDDPAAGQGELSVEEWKDVLDQLRRMGCLSVLLTGGEVCVKEGFVDIARHATELGMLVDIYTNGIALDDETFDAIAALRPNSLSFSLYGGDAATHDAITKVKGSFDRTVRAAMMTRCAGIDTYIKTVVMRENVHSLASLVRLGERLNIPVNPAYAIIDTHTGKSGASHRLNSVEEYAEAIKTFSRAGMAGTAQGARDPDSYVCSAGLATLSIDPRGGVHPCNSLSIELGNVRRTPIQDIWQNAPALEALKCLRFRDVCGQCAACESKDYCSICLGRTGWTPGEATVIPEDICQVAHAQRRVDQWLKENEEGQA